MFHCLIINSTRVMHIIVTTGSCPFSISWLLRKGSAMSRSAIISVNRPGMTRTSCLKSKELCLWPQPRDQTAVFFKWKTRKDNGNMQVSCPGQHNLTLQPKYSPNLAPCVLFPKMKSVFLVLAVDLIQIHGKIASAHHVPVVTKMHVLMLIE